MLVVGLGTIAAPLDTAVNIAFPSITAAFALEVQDIRWVVLSYVLTYASLMLVFGKLGDLLGYRQIFRLGLVVSAAGFAGCGLAPTYGLLLVARILQGVGIALILSCGPALATSLFPEAERARALGAYAAIMAAGSAIGPLLGGMLVERWGWSAVFWFRAPLVLVALALSGGLAAAPRNDHSRRFDAAGALLLVVWMNALPLAFAVPVTNWGALLPLGLGATAIIAFAAFVTREAHHPEPIIRPALFRDADFAIINAASIAMNLAAFAVLLLVPYYLVRVAELEAGAGGVVLALGAGGMILGAWAAGRLARHAKTGLLALAGVLLNIFGLWGISAWTPDTGFGLIALTLLGQGLGIGLFQVAYTDRVTATLPLADRGVAGSLAMVTRTIGVAGGATGLSAAFRTFESAALSARAAPPMPSSPPSRPPSSGSPPRSPCAWGSACCARARGSMSLEADWQLLAMMGLS